MTFSISLGRCQIHIMCQETPLKWTKQTKFEKNKQEPQIKQHQRKPKQPQKETWDLCLQHIFLLENGTLKANAVRFFRKMKNMLQAWFWSCTRPLKNVLNRHEKKCFCFFLVFPPDEKNVLLYWMLVLVRNWGLVISDEQATAGVQFQSCFSNLLYHFIWKSR